MTFAAKWEALRDGRMEDRAGAAAKPRDAQTVEAILTAMGVESYDPRVVNQLLELLYRYVSSVLQDSRLYSEHADKPAIDAEDVKLAIRSRCNVAFTQPPSRDVTVRLAAERNAVPLPAVDRKAGVALPDRQFQLTAQNYHVVVDPPRAAVGAPKSAVGSPKRKRFSAPMASASGDAPKTEQPTTSVPPAAAAPAPMDIDSGARASAEAVPAPASSLPGAAATAPASVAKVAPSTVQVPSVPAGAVTKDVIAPGASLANPLAPVAGATPMSGVVAATPVASPVKTPMATASPSTAAAPPISTAAPFTSGTSLAHTDKPPS